MVYHEMSSSNYLPQLSSFRLSCFEISIELVFRYKVVLARNSGVHFGKLKLWEAAYHVSSKPVWTTMRALILKQFFKRNWDVSAETLKLFCEGAEKNEQALSAGVEKIRKSKENINQVGWSQNRLQGRNGI